MVFKLKVLFPVPVRCGRQTSTVSSCEIEVSVIKGSLIGGKDVKVSGTASRSPTTLAVVFPPKLNGSMSSRDIVSTSPSSSLTHTGCLVAILFKLLASLPSTGRGVLGIPLLALDSKLTLGRFDLTLIVECVGVGYAETLLFIVLEISKVANP